jgi:isocitrate dehydrogenase kinase/phosphatase
MRVDYPEPSVGSTVMGAARPAPGDGEIAHAFESALYGMRCAQLVVEAFLSYNASFREITRRAIERFADRDWHGSQRDAVERIELYERYMQATVLELEGALGENARRRGLWTEVKRHFTNLTEGLPDNEFCKTFFSSVTRQLFGTVGVSPDIEFVATDLNPLAAAQPPTHRVTRVHKMHGDLTLLIRKLLESQPLRAPWADLSASAWVVASALERMLWQRGELRHIESLEVIDAVFYQSTRAYLVGRLLGRRVTTPIAIALRSTEAGVVVDATMLSEDELSILFGFARSYFHVDLEHVADTVSFLKQLLPRKPAGELFTVLGRAKQGKTERYRSLFRHLSSSEDQFVPAPGQRGLVMICFTLPSFDVVFKVIRDRIAEVKSVSKKDVMAKYSFVFRHDRAGRLIDAQEFRRLRFPMARFSAALLDELCAEAGDTVHVAGGDLIFDHLYIERRVTPLDIFLRDAPEALARQAAVDYGRAIRDLAYTDVFPGDLLLKNFGVTRHGRVVFYDYDELCRVSDCQFRDLPQAQCDEDEMRAEPWYFVGEHDIFPETLLSFLGMSGPMREEYLRAHADLYQPGFWRRTQQRIAAGEVLEVLPYLPPEYDAAAGAPKGAGGSSSGATALAGSASG